MREGASACNLASPRTASAAVVAQPAPTSDSVKCMPPFTSSKNVLTTFTLYFYSPPTSLRVYFPSDAWNGVQGFLRIVRGDRARWVFSARSFNPQGITSLLEVAHESLTWRHRLSVAIISSASGLTARGYQHSTSTLQAPALLSRMITVTPTVACHSHPDYPSTRKRWLAVRQMKSTPRFMSLNR